MSNEFVMVPRELLDRVLDPITSEGYINAKHEICVLMTKSAEQHQGSKIADALEACEWTGAPIGNKAIILSAINALRADPGEVERLRGQINEWAGKWEKAINAGAVMEGERNALRAQLADLEKLHGGELGLPKEGWPKYHKRKMETLRNLTAGYYERKLAERDALLRDVQRGMREYEQGCDQFPPFHHNQLMERIDTALSASAEPSASTEREAWALQEEKRLGIERLPVEPCAPVEIDERAAFEAWAKEQGLSVSRTPQALCFYNGMRRATGDYIDLSSLCSYAAWQARAALERKP